MTDSSYDNVYTLIIIANVMVGVFSASIAYVFISRSRKINIPYNIAVIGLPRSGKTTLITSMFQAIFFHKFLSSRFTPRGTETIDKVNENISIIKMGKSLGPTPEQDIFSYRADLNFKRFFLNYNYRISIGDFAGEYSESLTDNKKISWLHETTFFKWVMEADAFIFVIDVAAYFSENQDDYVTRVESDFRSVWQHLAEYHLEGKKSIKSKKVAIVLNKFDILLRLKDRNFPLDMPDDMKKRSLRTDMVELSKLGFSKETPDVIVVLETDVRKSAERIEKSFEPIRKYLSYQSKYTEEFCVSSFAFIEHENNPLGIRQLIEFILPNNPL
jgi:hypothetical protein